MKKFLEKMPIIKYILNSFIKWFLIFSIAFGALYAVLSVFGIYSQLENVLDLKYNSPFVLIPLYGFAALAVLCFVIGFLLYFHKYKRSKSKTKFNETLSNVVENK